MWRWRCTLGREPHRAAITDRQVHPRHGGSPHVHPASGHRGEHLVVGLWHNPGMQTAAKGFFLVLLCRWTGTMRRSASETSAGSAACSTPSGSSTSWRPRPERSRSGGASRSYERQSADVTSVTCCVRFRRLKRPCGDGKSSTSSSKLSEPSSVLPRASARTAPCCRSPTSPTSIKCLRGAKRDTWVTSTPAAVLYRM